MMSTTTEEPTVNVSLAQELGLTPDEFERIKTLLDRSPNFTELSLFSVMWSEHCCYKNSIRLLKTLPSEGPQLLIGAGEENAGMVDLGAGLACAFKIESHNHPSAIEPYQGAATGVGGIHRDIFTLGARPIAALNSLRFGDLDESKTKRLLKGVTKGIGDYGNSFGVPTVGGEIYFDRAYNRNPLVNAMSVGIVEKDKTVSATAEGAGNPVYIVGSATGKDGIHGASFASEDIGEDSEENLPAVQVGDPFQEKLLLEATQEANEAGLLIGMQDMGAAGIGCSTSEMADDGGHGMIIHLDQVPTRQPNMEPFELLLSESQERMLIVCPKGKENELEAIFEKWDLNCAVIGEVTEEERLRYYMDGELVADLAPRNLVLGGDAPVYKRQGQPPAYLQKIKAFSLDGVPEPNNLQDAMEALLSEPTIASKRWVYEQYDSMVRTDNMTTNAPSDAAVVRIKGTNKALCVTTDCNSHYIYADPKKGGMIAVAEAARNVVCSGGQPTAITDCLNFGNPLNTEVYWQFEGAVNGIKEACEAFETPVTGGNVSLYNQSGEGGPVLPSPVIGMLGVLEDRSLHMTLDFKQAGDHLYLLGPVKEDVGSSQYVLHYHNQHYSPAPFFDLETELAVQQAVQTLIGKQLIQSAHDVSEGGLLTTLAESGFPRQLGFSITTDTTIRPDAYLFGEGQSRVVVSVSPEKQAPFEQAVQTEKVPLQRLGVVTEGSIKVNETAYPAIEHFLHLYEKALPEQLGEA